jgi:hypothetical protein
MIHVDFDRMSKRIPARSASPEAGGDYQGEGEGKAG